MTNEFVTALDKVHCRHFAGSVSIFSLISLGRAGQENDSLSTTSGFFILSFIKSVENMKAAISFFFPKIQSIFIAHSNCLQFELTDN